MKTYGLEKNIPMTDNQGDKASTAMQLIMNLEVKVREKNERIKELEGKVKYLTFMCLVGVTKNNAFWWGWFGGVGVSMLVVGILKWVRVL